VKRLAIITTHPIQYNAPLFKKLHERGKIEITVYYTLSQSAKIINDKKFGRQINWDIPLLEGYHFKFIKNISPIPDSNGFFGVINKGLMNEIAHNKYDAVLVYGWHHWSHFLLMQTLSSKQKIYFRGDSILLDKPNWFKEILKKVFLRFTYKNVNKAFYVGIRNKEYMLSYGIKNKDLIYAPHVVDNDRFTLEKGKIITKSIEKRTVLGFSPTDIVFIYTGKFYRLKRLDLLIKVFKTIPNKNMKLLLVGNGEDELKLKNMAINDERIIFESFKNQSEMPWVYRIGDVFVLPSESETWGLSVNEAMVCGIPAIVSSSCGCAPELIIEGETGYVFKVNNEDELRTKMMKFEDKSTCSRMGDNASLHISSFNIDSLACIYENELNRES